MGKLSRGESVTTPEGRVVTSEECMSPSIPGGITLIIDCPSEEFIDILSSNSCLLYYLSQNNIISIFHLTPLPILLNESYIKIFSKLSSKIKQVFVFGNDNFCSPVYIASNELQVKLQSVLSDSVMPCLYETSFDNFNGIRNNNREHQKLLSELYCGSVFVGDITSTLHFYPIKKVKYENSDSYFVSIFSF